MNNNWIDYFEQTKNKPPRSLLVKALPFVAQKNEALDLGAGALNDSKYLLAQGFKHVLAVDKEPVAMEIATELSRDKFTYTISDIEKYDFPKDHYDLINAQYTLPFIAPEKFNSIFKNIIGSLKRVGIFIMSLPANSGSNIGHHCQQTKCNHQYD